MTRSTRSLLIAIGGVVLAAALILVVIRDDGQDSDPAEQSPPPSGIKRAIDRLRNPGTDQGRVHRPDRNVTEPEEADEAEFTELWQILEDEQAEDVVKESAALKLAARGGAEAISKLWNLWQAGKLPSSCSWIVDMANTGTGLEAGTDPAQRHLPRISAERVAEAVAQLMNAELPVEERQQAIRLLGRAGTEEALAALAVVAAGANTTSPELRQSAFEAIAATDVDRAASLLSAGLQEESMDAEALVEHLEALEESSSVAVTRLALSLLQHENADVRDQAAWLIALNIDDQPELMPEVLSALKVETSAGVRSRLYDSLGGEAAGEAHAILQLVQQEEHASAQIAGYQALGRMAAADADGFAAQLFDTQVVPLLVDSALNSPDFQTRFGAFVGLRYARTEGAKAALQRLATEAEDRRIAQAAAAAAAH